MIKPKGIVFDMDGVLRVGNNAIPNTNDIINLMVMNNIFLMLPIAYFLKYF